MTSLRLIVIILALLICAGCDHTSSRLLPRQLEGVWTTDDPRYCDKFIELFQAFVIIVTGLHDKPSVQMVNKVETQATAGGTELTVYSTDYAQGLHYQLALQFSPADGGEIRFRNQAQVWKRRVDASQ